MAKVNAESQGRPIRQQFLQAHFHQAAARDQRFNYLVDFSTKWHGPYLQFIARYACPGTNALSPFFETAFARLGYFRDDAWSIWARRHNDQWMVLGHQLTNRGMFSEMRRECADRCRIDKGLP
jgi:hypothetical protein